MTGLELLSIKIFSVKVILVEINITDSVLKTNPWTYKLRDLNGEKNRKFLWKRIVVEYIINKLLSRTRQLY